MDKKRHILFLITSLRYGGAERVVSNLSRFFAESDKYRISIMLLEEGIDYPVYRKIEITKLHSKQRGTFNKLLSLIYDPFRLKRFVKKRNVDIVLSFMQRPNAINMLSRLLGARHASYVNVRCRMTIHYNTRYKNTPLFIKSISKWILKWLWRYADRTITNSVDIKDEVVTLFDVKPETVDVIYNPLDLKDIERRSKEKIDEEWFTKKDIPVIINVGRLAKAKGHTYLLKAFALVAAKRQVRLVIIGDGELKEPLINETKRLNITDKVYFMEWQNNPYKYIAHSSAFVLSSIYEGFPNVLLEAMACGCPVVATNCPSGPSEILLPQDNDKGDIVEAQYGVLVKDQNEAPLSKAIEYILDNRDIADKYAKKGFEKAKEFNLDVIAENYEKVIVG